VARWIGSAEAAAGRAGRDLAKAVAAEVRAELPAIQGQAILAAVTDTARIFAAAVTRGVWEENQRQIDAGQRWTFGEKVALGVGIAAGILIALIIGRSVERLRLELHRAMDRVAELERQRRAAGDSKGP